MLLPYSDKLPIEKLCSCFKNTTNAYKFYWFLSILDHLLEKRTVNIPIKEIAIRMIANAWYPLDYYKLSFGKQDGFKKIAISISNKMKVNNSPNSESLFNQIQQKLHEKEINEIYRDVYVLLRWVPYRFIRPFFSNELRSLPDSQINNLIIKLANSPININRSPYYFGENEIIISKEWNKYFQTNQIVLRHFIKWNLIKFLQKNNSNVIGLSVKLEKPVARDMKSAKLFWSQYLEQKPTKCIYSNVKLNYSSFSIDHFIPWTFIAHDHLWNLIPTTKSVNSIKSNQLPSIEEYLNKFSLLHYKAFTFHFTNENFRFLEDYSSFFGTSIDEIHKFDILLFRQKVEQRITPLIETAKNLGFNFPFIYRK